MEHVDHKPAPLDPSRTACGHLWQVWQAPDVYSQGHLGVLPGPEEGPPEPARECAVCLAELKRWEDEAPIRSEAKRRLEEAAGARR